MKPSTSERKAAEMKPPTKEFLDELAERARISGWSHDYVEVKQFVKDLFTEAGIPCPNLEPYPYDDGEK